MQKILDFLSSLASILKQAALYFVDIAHYACFIVAIILIVTSVAADARGQNIGFAAGKWAISAGIVGSLISVARQIYGV